jgi:Kef-type K+ transport system membrane component KefB
LTTFVDRLRISQGTLAFTLVILLLFSWAAEVIGGMAAITGAFLVGLFLARTPYKAKIEAGVSAMAYGFFVPIFFVNIGLEVNLLAVSGNAIWFAVILVLVAVISKVLGSGLGARMGGFTLRESIQLGIGMVSRGEVGLIVAAFALAEGLLSPANFAIVVFMVIVATLVTPPLLRLSFASRREPQAQDAGR